MGTQIMKTSPLTVFAWLIVVSLLPYVGYTIYQAGSEDGVAFREYMEGR